MAIREPERHALTLAGCAALGVSMACAGAPDELSAYDAITCAMDGAVAYYDCNTRITKQLNVTYDPSVPTADGNYNGSVRFGGRAYMECVTGMHEIAHTVGVGTAPKWGMDTQHFWPYGLNYTSEAHGTADLIDHCLMVMAIRKDLGL